MPLTAVTNAEPPLRINSPKKMSRSAGLACCAMNSIFAASPCCCCATPTTRLRSISAPVRPMPRAVPSTSACTPLPRAAACAFTQRCFPPKAPAKARFTHGTQHSSLRCPPATRCASAVLAEMLKKQFPARQSSASLRPLNNLTHAGHRPRTCSRTRWPPHSRLRGISATSRCGNRGRRWPACAIGLALNQ